MKAKVAVWGAILLYLATSAATSAAEVARSSMELSVTISDSGTGTWSSPMVMHLPTVMALIGLALIAISIRRSSSKMRRCTVRMIRELTAHAASYWQGMRLGVARALPGHS